MAELDDLVAQIADPEVRRRLASAIKELKRHRRFGLVFEKHIPELAVLPGVTPDVGDLVRIRTDPSNGLRRVVSVGDGVAILEPVQGGDQEEHKLDNVWPVQRLGEPIYPTLTPLGSIERASAKSYHAVVNGENYHVLQLLLYLYEGRVDCIYIDPPYNTGARDWKYNNRFVDTNDMWRHSKWLAMMEKRLKLAKRLLKSDGVLICTIDSHEVHHLGMLMEQVFPEYLRYIVTMVINPKGREKANFAPVDEYVLFVVPDLGRDVIEPAPVEDMRLDQQVLDFDDESSDEAAEEIEPVAAPDGEDEWEYRHARRRGGGAESSSYREARPNQFYPVYIDEKKRTVVRVGMAIPPDAEPDFRRKGGLRPLWPIDTAGRHRVWAFVPDSMQRLIDEGHVFLGRYHRARDDWTLKYRVPKKRLRKLKTVWLAKAYDAGTHGTEVLKAYLGQPGLFPFPKSIYAVRDALAAVVRSRPDALILDFFAGSGTTLHSVCLLNLEDEGRRRCILVTNNEVEEEKAQALNEAGHYSGDPEYERHGIFENVTRPRVQAMLTGRRPDGQPVPGQHVWAGRRPFAAGFEENAEFYQLTYFDRDEIDLGSRFEEILPLLWLAGGAIGDRPPPPREGSMLIPLNAPFAVLFDEARAREFAEHLEKRPDITHVFLITDSPEAFAEMRALVGPGRHVSMLYRDFLRTFTVNTRERT